MNRKIETPATPIEPTRRVPDIFAEARRRANRRRSLLEEHAALLAEASPGARALVEALEKVPNGVEALEAQPGDVDAEA